MIKECGILEEWSQGFALVETLRIHAKKQIKRNHMLKRISSVVNFLQIGKNIGQGSKPWILLLYLAVLDSVPLSPS